MKKNMTFRCSTECFYDLRFHKDIPVDAMEVTVDEFNSLSVGRNAGKKILFESGELILVDREPMALSKEEIETSERMWRDGAMTDVQWLRDRHRDELELGLKPTLSSERFADLLGYLQELRDWPQSELFPKVEHRPVAPTWISATHANK